eukprot:3932915-Rhodomonas_salina.3
MRSGSGSSELPARGAPGKSAACPRNERGSGVRNALLRDELGTIQLEDRPREARLGAFIHSLAMRARASPTTRGLELRASGCPTRSCEARSRGQQDAQAFWLLIWSSSTCSRGKRKRSLVRGRGEGARGKEGGDLEDELALRGDDRREALRETNTTHAPTASAQTQT